MAFVYRFKHYITNEIIYIGQTSRKLNTRMNEHFGKRGHLPDKCYSSVGKIEYIEVDSNADALLVEQYMINKYKPKYNTDGKVNDNQTFKYKFLMSFMINSKWQPYEIKRKNIIPFGFFGIKIPNIFRSKNKQYKNKKEEMVDIGVNIVFIYAIIATLVDYFSSK